MPDPLDTILRLRRVAVDDARRELAALLRAHDAAQARAEAAEALIGEEAEVAADLFKDDAAVEAFAAWLPAGRASAAAARAELDQLGAEVARARAAVTVARAAAEAAQDLLSRRAAERDVQSRRRAQAAMDEIAAAVRAPG